MSEQTAPTTDPEPTASTAAGGRRISPIAYGIASLVLGAVGAVLIPLGWGWALLAGVAAVLVGLAGRGRAGLTRPGARRVANAGAILGAALFAGFFAYLFFVMLPRSEVDVWQDGKFQLGRIIEWIVNLLREQLSHTTKILSGWIEGAVRRIAETLMVQPLAVGGLVAGTVLGGLAQRLGAIAALATFVALAAAGFLGDAWLLPLREDLNAPAIIVLLTVFAWWVSGRWGVGVFTLLGLGLIWNLNLWDSTAQTLALVILATLVAIAIGIPVGIIASVSTPFRLAIMPVLDFMQTLPAFVYLIPAIPFFGLGATSAIFSTVIFAMPPSIRLTILGVRQVPEELVEAADAFGSTTAQKLVKLQLPLAGPSIRQGINQTIMLSLSMVVIAAMIGAKGLGADVWRAIQRVDIGLGFEAGIGIVILAIILDRIMQSAGGRPKTA